MRKKAFSYQLSAIRLIIVSVVFVALFIILNSLFIIPAFAQTATLSLDPSSASINKGCTFSVNINLDTGGIQTDGTDAIIIYDPTRFLGQSVTNGTIYPDYPGSNIDNSAGKITVSGLASISTPFSGKGLLATVNFTVPSTAPTGTTQITFDFDPQNKSKTTDSNVVQRETIMEVLGSVTNGIYTIGTGSCTAPVVSPSPTTTKPAVTAPPVYLPQTGGVVGSTPSGGFVPEETLPPAGSPQLTFTLALVGGVLTVLGIIGIALL